jgi:homoserine/homoserine lactone efflux protein
MISASKNSLLGDENMNMNVDAYLAYVAVCAVAVVIPGPTNALILANGMRHGVRAGLLNVAGTQVGVGLMIATVAIGLTSVVNAVGHWFEWIKLAGAVYLIVLGIQLFRSAAKSQGVPRRDAPRGGFFVQGLVVSLSNPKQLLFFGALLPQFLDPAGNQSLQIAILGGTAMLLAALSDSAYALISGRIAGRVHPDRVRAASRVGGLCLIGGGLWLALAKSKP